MREMQRKNLIIPLVGDRVIYFQRRKLSRRESETGVLSEYRGAPDRLDPARFFAMCWGTQHEHYCRGGGPG